MEIDRRLPDLTESFEPCAPEARPGARLMDRFSAQIDFNDCGHLEDDEALQQYFTLPHPQALESSGFHGFHRILWTSIDSENATSKKFKVHF